MQADVPASSKQMGSGSPAYGIEYMHPRRDNLQPKYSWKFCLCGLAATFNGKCHFPGDNPWHKAKPSHHTVLVVQDVCIYVVWE